MALMNSGMSNHGVFSDAIGDSQSPRLPRLTSGLLSSSTSYPTPKARSQFGRSLKFTHTATHQTWISNHGEGVPRPTTITPLFHRRGTVLLSKPLKSKKVSTDARDKAIKSMRVDLHKSEQEVQRLRGSNRELEAEHKALSARFDQLQNTLQKEQEYRSSLLKRLLMDCKKEHIYWKEGDPVFVLKEESQSKGNGDDNGDSVGLKAMDMNLSINEYPSATETAFESASTVDDDMKSSDGAVFERYLAKLIRCSRIFQDQYTKLRCTKEEIVKRHRQSIAKNLSETDKLRIEYDALRQENKNLKQSNEREIDQLKVKQANMEKDLEAERRAMEEERSQMTLRQQQIAEDAERKLQIQIAAQKDLITAKRKAEIEKAKAVEDKEKWESDYSAVQNQLQELLKHPLFKTRNAVDNALHFRRIQHEFDHILSAPNDPTNAKHVVAYEALRKQMRKTMGFTAKYCKQMTLKVLFEIVHFVNQKVHDIFHRIRKQIAVTLGIESIDDDDDRKKEEEEEEEDGDGGKKRDLQNAMDFLIKYQFDAIFEHLSHRTMYHEVIEAVWLHQFELIGPQKEEEKEEKEVEEEGSGFFELYDASNPRERSPAMVEYINEITRICWKMIIYCRDIEDEDKKLCFWPRLFNEEEERVCDPDIHENLGKHSEKDCDHILFYVFPVVIRRRDEGNILNALAGVDEDEADEMAMNGDEMVDHDQFEESEATESKMDEEETMKKTKVLIRCVKRKEFHRKFKKEADGNEKGDGAEQMDRVDAVRLLVDPPSLAKIKENFASIHAQQHKTLMECIEEQIEGDDDSDSDGDEEEEEDDSGNDEEDGDDDGGIVIDDGDLAEMKAYKVLFDVLISCFMATSKIIDRIRGENVCIKQLRLNQEFHVMLNMAHYDKVEATEQNEKEKRIVTKLVHGIWTKYASIYPFLGDDEDIEGAMRRYILKCCNCCFHFGAYSLMTEDGTGYGLYPLCFVRDGTECAVTEELKEENMNNEAVQFERVKMSDDAVLMQYDDQWHEKEKTSTFDSGTRPRICFFTWPAIIETASNNEHLYGNVPKRALTKIWVQLNDELHDRIYGDAETESQ